MRVGCIALRERSGLTVARGLAQTEKTRLVARGPEHRKRQRIRRAYGSKNYYLPRRYQQSLCCRKYECGEDVRDAGPREQRADRLLLTRHRNHGPGWDLGKDSAVVSHASRSRDCLAAGGARYCCLSLPDALLRARGRNLYLRVQSWCLHSPSPGGDALQGRIARQG